VVRKDSFDQSPNPENRTSMSHKQPDQNSTQPDRPSPKIDLTGTILPHFLATFNDLVPDDDCPKRGDNCADNYLGKVLKCSCIFYLFVRIQADALPVCGIAP
jgi:hypothetical protein